MPLLNPKSKFQVSKIFLEALEMAHTGGHSSYNSAPRKKKKSPRGVPPLLGSHTKNADCKPHGLCRAHFVCWSILTVTAWETLINSFLTHHAIDIDKYSISPELCPFFLA